MVFRSSGVWEWHRNLKNCTGDFNIVRQYFDPKVLCWSSLGSLFEQLTSTLCLSFRLEALVLPPQLVCPSPGPFSYPYFDATQRRSIHWPIRDPRLLPRQRQTVLQKKRSDNTERKARSNMLPVSPTSASKRPGRHSN